MGEGIVVLIIVVYIIYLILEYRQTKKLREVFKHIVHVNGTRGKSSTTRLIASALAQGGYKVFCKTTGTSAMTIDINGKEEEINRRGKPNIKEQISIMKRAKNQGAEILVIECMAVKPELQYISQHKILNADISVITNARRDHLEEMGPSLEEIAKSLGNVIPKDGYLVTAEDKFYDYYKDQGEKLNTKVILSDKHSEDYEIDFAENVNIVLDICEILNVDKAKALEGMKNYKRDPGVLKIYRLKDTEKEVFFINGFAVNDPDSTMQVYEYLKKKNVFKDKEIIVMVNNRRDRPYRMKQHVEVINYINPSKIWISGKYLNLMKKYLLKEGINEEKIFLIKDAGKVNFKDINKSTAIYGIGNIVGNGEKIVEVVERTSDIIVK
ncbi:poly-gamma-glutamate synthase PgsB/CapB [Clostridium pascui]|uniref:poly-gamma-glutamate synthase PgsB n=1 Tax=Clostridium pascui TaxID=46609 RepID=UPI001958794D|nr:poly-gamma-glutamate synthase PgsB [Clostridium pascui]MBM7870678.1 poly-gamma-glutamate synthase PgsB/CapB [Clostridium pascui]